MTDRTPDDESQLIAFGKKSYGEPSEILIDPPVTRRAQEVLAQSYAAPFEKQTREWMASLPPTDLKVFLLRIQNEVARLEAIKAFVLSVNWPINEFTPKDVHVLLSFITTIFRKIRRALKANSSSSGHVYLIETPAQTGILQEIYLLEHVEDDFVMSEWYPLRYHIYLCRALDEAEKLLKRRYSAADVLTQSQLFESKIIRLFDLQELMNAFPRGVSSASIASREATASSTSDDELSFLETPVEERLAFLTDVLAHCSSDE